MFSTLLIGNSQWAIALFAVMTRTFAGFGLQVGEPELAG
jgi:hypothetical protein